METGKGADPGGVTIDRMRPELLEHWNEMGEIFERRRAEMAAEPIAGELLAKVKRYEAALYRIVEKEREQKALIEHREKTGQEVTEADRQRWFAYLDTAHIAEAALGKER